MSTESDISTVPGVRPSAEIKTVVFPIEEVAGHWSGGERDAARLRCWNCREAFPVATPLREDTYYVCPACFSLNQADLQTRPMAAAETGSGVSKASGTYRAPVVLDSVFLRGPDGSLFELPLEEAERFMVTPDRATELGHAPYPAGRQEVAGHHMVAGGSAADPSNWGFHQSWEFGCYFDDAAGAFIIGMHRHPYGDERAVPASPGDFA